jgi:hypothetical protein
MAYFKSLAIASAVLFSSSAFCHKIYLDGTYEGKCQSYSDGLQWGALNYHFSSNGSYRSFIQYYDGVGCQPPQGHRESLYSGSYTITPRGGAQGMDLLTLSNSIFSSDNYSLEWGSSDLKICDENGKRCQKFRRI